MKEIVIKIEEETYNRIMNGWMPLHKAVNLMENVQKGTPLPKGHGRIIDESKINKCGWNFVNHHAKTDAPTIIEGSESK